MGRTSGYIQCPRSPFNISHLKQVSKNGSRGGRALRACKTHPSNLVFLPLEYGEGDQIGKELKGWFKNEC